MPSPYDQVLSLGFLMTSYLKWCGLTEAEVSIYRGIGAITGLLATFVYPTLRKQMGEQLHLFEFDLTKSIIV